MSLCQLDHSKIQNQPKAQPNSGQTCYRIHADVEVSVLARVLELFTLRDLIPDQVRFERGSEGLELTLKLPALPDWQSENLARRMRNILPVRTVVWSHL